MSRRRLTGWSGFQWLGHKRLAAQVMMSAAGRSFNGLLLLLLQATVEWFKTTTATFAAADLRLSGIRSSDRMQSNSAIDRQPIVDS